MNLSELYQEFSPAVYRLCLKYSKDSAQAEDLMQEVFVKVHHNLESFDAKAKYFTWIYRIASNHCLDWIRIKKRRGELVDLHVIPFHAQNDRADKETENKRLVDQILSKLNTKTRQILFLYYIEGNTYEEIAEIMGVSRAAIHKRLKKINIDEIMGNILILALVLHTIRVMQEGL